jgi:hypothetical protein
VWCGVVWCGVGGVAWWSGNLLELAEAARAAAPAPSSSSPTAGAPLSEALFLALVKAALALLRPLARSATCFQHPLLAAQLALLASGNTLQQLYTTLTAGAAQALAEPPDRKATALVDVCQLLDVLLHDWPYAEHSLLSTLAFSPELLPALWTTIQVTFLCVPSESKPLGVLLAVDGATAEAQLDAKLVLRGPADLGSAFGSLVAAFAACYAHLLVVLSDDEFFVRQQPFSLQTAVAPMVWLCRSLVWLLFYSDLAQTTLAAKLRPHVVGLFQQLRERQSRQPFLPAEAWLLRPAASSREAASSLSLSLDGKGGVSGVSAQVLAELPFVFSFDQRVALFYSLVDEDKRRFEAEHPGVFAHGLGGFPVTIRRRSLLADGFQRLNPLGPRLKGRVKISFVDHTGLPEAGIDGGGLFKEFLTELIQLAFNPNYGLFKETSDHFVYPNPASALVPDAEDRLEFYAFVGRIIGKALYDGIQVEPRFTNFFLRATLGQYNYVNDLQTLDPELFTSLMFLKRYEGEFSDLGLTFTVTQTALGEHKELELLPGGAEIEVTRQNLSRFLYLMADFKLNKETAGQSSAFFAGMRELVDLSWLRMFAADELGTLLSGSERLDLKDLRAHTNYANGYSDDHELIRWFWEILDSLPVSECAQFLRFATSCPRAPLLGFRTLQPKFCIQHMGNMQDALPTRSFRQRGSVPYMIFPKVDVCAVCSATCFNLLRIPRYMSKALLREKLLYAVRSNAGFGLS